MSSAEAANPPAETSLADDLEHLMRLMIRMPTSGGLSLAAATVINRLVVKGPLRLSALANAEGVSQPGMTQLVSRLEREGYLRRDADPNDGRAVVVVVTRKGRELAARRRAERAEALARLVAKLSPEDQHSLEAARDALRDLAGHAQEAVRRSAYLAES